jgi:hypothetical protein
VCDSKSFEVTPPKKDADRKCDVMTVCKNYGDDGGEYESKANTKNRDRECTKIKVCDDETEYESREPTARLDRICNKLTTCKDTEWEEAPAEPASDRLCSPLTVCDDNHATDSKTEWEKTAPDEYTDRECEKVTVCGAAQYEARSAGQANDRECKALDVCKATEWENKAATRTSNRECTESTKCGTGERQITPLKKTADRKCASSRPFGGFRRSARSGKSGKAGSVRFSSALPEPPSEPPCANGHYESKPPTETSDRICTAVRKCNANNEFQISGPTTTKNRVCQAHTRCNFAVQWEKKDSASGSADRVCKALTVCGGGRWQKEKQTQFTDRVCVKHTKCTMDETLYRHGGALHDAECRGYAGGAFVETSTTALSTVHAFSRDNRWRDMHDLGRGVNVRVGGRVAMIRYHFSAHGGNNSIRMRLLVDGDEKEEARSVNQKSYIYSV